MNVNNFLILKKLKEFIIDLEILVKTMPRKDLYSREMIYKDALDLYELIVKSNYVLDPIFKKNYQIEALAKVSKIDLFLERAYKNKYISEKQLLNKTKELRELNAMIYAWYKNGCKVPKTS